MTKIELVTNSSSAPVEIPVSDLTTDSPDLPVHPDAKASQRALYEDQ